MKTPFFYICLLGSLPLLSQEYNYVHYDTKDGLAGSTVYRIAQDKEGYMWFATDNGVSMFDGKTFRNFTTEDGLTDNDILAIHSDSKGRVWMMPFNKSVCYYYKGKIHNRYNDSTLSNALFSSFVNMGGETNNGEVLFMTSEQILIYKNSGEIKLLVDMNDIARRYHVKPFNFLSVNLYKQYPYSMVFFNANDVFVYRGDSIAFLKKIKSNPTKFYNFLSIDENLEMKYPAGYVPTDYTTIVPISPAQYIYNTQNGSWLLDSNGIPDPRPFLPGKRVSYSMKDSEGNLWFSTMGDGIFRLTSPSMKTFPSKDALCIEGSDERIHAGSADGSLKIIHQGQLEKDLYFPVIEPEKMLTRRLYALKAGMDNNLFLGFDCYLGRINGRESVFTTINPIKSIDIIDRDHIVVCTNRFTLKLRNSDLHIVDTIWKERGTKVIYDKGSYFIGTLDGLVIIHPGGKAIRGGDNNPLLAKRIVDMYKMPDGSFWIATNDNGVLLYRNGLVETVINTSNGLSSNICKSIFVKDGDLWVGTNKGLNKIDTRTKEVLIRYSTSDGLASDVINAIYTKDSIIWVCSPAGITYFNEKHIADSSICKLNLTSIRVADSLTTTTAPLHLSYKNNSIAFEYTAISFKSAGEIIYRYQLRGLDADWKETSSNSLSYPSLPPGDYEFQLYAVNKFGKKSDIVSVPFAIKAPFWRTAWFWIGLSLFVTGMVWYLLSLRYKRWRKRLNEKNELLQRMTELEQSSLRAQMNPHFIFNCLNSIQHFILKKDIRQTNRYIAQFGSLIRQTLDNSSKANISIADEIKYLTNYLELEKMRFSSSFDYKISVDDDIRTDFIYIPSMLLQPFVENAIRHGIRYKENETGLIRILITQDDTTIHFVIEDNGVGREAAARYKSQQHIEYQSKGITLTQKRVDILNAHSSKKISAVITDLKDENNYPAGTRVSLSFPLAIIEKLK